MPGVILVAHNFHTTMVRNIYLLNKKRAAWCIHVAPACTSPREGSDHFVRC
jgi:hypothetical protein